MNHETALHTMAAERYALREMTPEERDAFEEHFFDCSECAEAVRDTTIFYDSGRSVVRESEGVGRRAATAWRHRLPAAAAIVLAAIVGWQNVVQPQLDARPAIELSQPEILTEPTRAAVRTVVLSKDDPRPLYIEVPPEYARYRSVLTGATGKKVEAEITAERGKDWVNVSLRELPAGRYSLVIEGVREDGSRSPIATYELTVQ